MKIDSKIQSLLIKHWPIILCLIIYLALLLFNRFSTHVYVNYWQLLPQKALLQEPFVSIVQLHSQPPLFNILYGVLLHLESWTNISIDAQATFLFSIITITCIILCYVITLLYSDSVLCAAISAVLITANPSLYFHQTIFLYTPIESLLVLLSFFSAFYLFKNKTLKNYIGYLIPGILLVLLRSLWHPLFFIIYGLLPVLYFLMSSTFADKKYIYQMILGLFILFTVFIFPLLIKNIVLFNNSGTSSWLALSLDDKVFEAYMDTNEKENYFSEDELLEFYDKETLDRHRQYLATSMLYQDDKETLQNQSLEKLPANFNHLNIPKLNSGGASRQLEFWKDNPRYFIHRLFVNFASLHLPATILLGDADRNNGTYEYHWEHHGNYIYLHDQIYYGNWTTSILSVKIGSMVIRPNIFMLLIIPAFVVCLIYFCIREQDELLKPYFLLTALYLFWFLAMVILIDGQESNRMRWSIEPACTVCAVIILKKLIWSKIYGTELETEENDTDINQSS